MFLTKPIKILSFSKWQNHLAKSNKNCTSGMLVANNNSARSYVRHIRL